MSVDRMTQTAPEPYCIYLIWQKHFLGWTDMNILTVIWDQSCSIQRTFPAIQHETLQQRGRNSSIVVRMPPALDPNVKLPNAKSKRKHSTEAASAGARNSIPHLSANLQLQHHRLRLAKGLFTAACWWQEQLPSDTSSYCYCSELSQEMLEEQRCGRNVKSTWSVIDGLVP